MTWKRFPHYGPICEEKPPVKGRFSSQWISNAELYVCFVVWLNKLLNKQSRTPWFEMSFHCIYIHCIQQTITVMLYDNSQNVPYNREISGECLQWANFTDTHRRQFYWIYNRNFHLKFKRCNRKKIWWLFQMLFFQINKLSSVGS